jgi:hypothetical protein
MQNHILNRMILATVLALCMAAAPAVQADVEVVYGRAVNAAGDVEYLEKHTVTYNNGQVLKIQTSFFDADNKVIGEQKSDFQHGPQFGSYEFNDTRNRYSDGVNVQDDHILLFCKETPSDSPNLKNLPRNANQIIGQGFHQFVSSRRHAIARGEVFHAKLVIPSKMDQFDVVIRKVKVDDQRVIARVELDNWLFNLFLPRIEAEYDLESGRLLTYKGIALISDASGKYPQITVTYQYPQGRTLVGANP